MASLIKLPICLFKGHRLDAPSIIDFMDKRNYLKRCSRCGLYHGYSVLSDISLTVTKRTATKFKNEFYKEFRSLQKDGEQDG